MMTIQLNTDNNLEVQQDYADKLTEMLQNGLKRFDEHLTRLEVHLSDENAAKEGKDDKKCLLEARPKGKQPIVVSANADTYDKAVHDAIDKMKTSLDRMIDKMQG